MAAQPKAGHGTAMASTTTYTHQDGLLVSLVDALGNETTWEYEAGREVKMTDPLGNEVVKTYYPDGKLQSILNRNELLRTFAYDADGRLETETWYAGATTLTSVVETLSWAYNADGLLASASNSVGTYTFEYDDSLRLIHVTQPFGVELSFGYDIFGNRNLVIDSFGGVEVSLYNYSGQLVRRTLEQDSTEMRLDFTYTAEGRAETISRYSDLAGTQVVAKSFYEYEDGRLTSLVHKDSSNDTIAEYLWEYDEAGQLVYWNDNGVERVYQYDAQGQLTQEAIDETEHDYDWDVGGNRTGWDHNEFYTNQLESDGVWTFTYDAEGNMTGKDEVGGDESWKYFYDHANQLIRVEEYDGLSLEHVVTFKYDVYGNRMEKVVDGAPIGPAVLIQKYAYDGWNTSKSTPIGNENWDVFADLHDNGSLATRYLRGDVVDQVFGRIDGNGPYWYLNDHLGSIRDVLDDNGAVVKSVGYDAFGNVLSETGSGVLGRYAWTGRERDVEIDLQYNRARYYDPTIGRWISEDPIRFAAGDGNLYRYVTNKPITVTDPSGLKPPSGSATAWDTEIATAVENIVEKMRAGSWSPTNVKNPGEFGNEVHTRVEAQLRKDPRWQFNVFVENKTNKIVGIGALPPGGVKGTTQIDVLYLNTTALV